MAVLVVGGTRNLGSLVVHRLLGEGFAVAVLNRGITPDRLPAEVERLQADRGNPEALSAAVGTREWDAVIDMTCYTGAHARHATAIFQGRVGRYLFISSGQVYLVRTGAGRPAREEEYEGAVMAEPVPGTRDHANWVYGVEKRAAEEAFRSAWLQQGFPVTALRLPMVHSQLDHYHRLHNYLLRLEDGDPIILPEGPDLDLRHVYGEDVAQVVVDLLRSTPSLGVGEAYNLGSEESLSLVATLELLAGFAGVTLRTVRVPRVTLEERDLLPACSPFSDPWMSSLDSTRAMRELGFAPTPPRSYLETLTRWYLDREHAMPEGYRQRDQERGLIESLDGVHR